MIQSLELEQFSALYLTDNDFLIVIMALNYLCQQVQYFIKLAFFISATRFQNRLQVLGQ